MGTERSKVTSFLPPGRALTADTGMFDTAVSGSSITAVISKLARNTGSSQPGKSLRACTGSIWVASMIRSTSCPPSRCL